AGSPVEFRIVGPIGVDRTADQAAARNLHWIGPIRRDQTGNEYRNADVFILPTWSDGFGLTQLEAQAWRLPVVASRFCGAGVEDGRNGIGLGAVTGDTIASALRRCLSSPELLLQLSKNALPMDRFVLESFGDRLAGLFDRDTQLA